MDVFQSTSYMASLVLVQGVSTVQLRKSLKINIESWECVAAERVGSTSLGSFFHFRCFPSPPPSLFCDGLQLLAVRTWPFKISFDTVFPSQLLSSSFSSIIFNSSPFVPGLSRSHLTLSFHRSFGLPLLLLSPSSAFHALLTDSN